MKMLMTPKSLSRLLLMFLRTSIYTAPSPYWSVPDDDDADADDNSFEPQKSESFKALWNVMWWAVADFRSVKVSHITYYAVWCCILYQNRKKAYDFCVGNVMTVGFFWQKKDAQCAILFR